MPEQMEPDQEQFTGEHFSSLLGDDNDFPADLLPSYLDDDNQDVDTSQMQQNARTARETLTLASLTNGNGNGSAGTHPPLPPGHMEVADGKSAGICPFAAIQNFLDSNPGDKAGLMGGNVKSGMEMSSRKPVAQEPFFHTSLDDNIPEEAAVKSPRAGRQMSKLSMREDDDKSIGHDGASKVSGSKMGGSKKTGKTKMSSKSKFGSAAKRTKKAPTFSSWEAQTYIPPIKKSWSSMLAKMPLEEIGMYFYDALLKAGDDQLKAKFTTARDIMAVKFAEMLASIVASVDNPYSMYEKLKGLAPMHIEKGVGKQHLPLMGQVLFGCIEHVLGDKFDMQARTAWEWLWAWLGATFTQSIEEAGNETTLISRTWDMAVDNFPDVMLGNLFYETLLGLAPNLKAVFSKPKQYLSTKFVEMLSTLVSFHNKLDDQNVYNEQMMWLGVRHVAYGSKFSHVEVLQEVLIATIGTAVGDDWTEEADQAWRNLWQTTCHRLLTLMTEAELHGKRVQDMWQQVQGKGKRQEFGVSLRKVLLSGTEWVQSLSSTHGTAMAGDGKKDSTNSPSTMARRPSTEAKHKKAIESLKGIMGGPSNTKLDEPGNEDEKSNGTDAEAIGNQFWEMLTVILALLWEPEQQNEKLILMTTKFFEAGIRMEHLQPIGVALMTACKNVIDKQWNEQYRAAWDWFWDLVSQSMKRTLKVCEERHVDVVVDSWAKCKEKLPTVELGESFFKELASIAPYLVHLFKRPKSIQAAQFVSAVDILVSFLQDPDKFFVDLKPLVIRHIKYGVKADYAKAFGTAILRGVKNCLGPEEWSTETEAAWGMLWERVSNILTRCLGAGTNLVILSLVNGDLDKVKEAMDCAARGERFNTLTKVDVNGEELSPLTWAIRDGLRDIALFLIEDLLTIRADRHSYYYGREDLFKTHPNIVEVLCKDPGVLELINCLLDGLMWHSNTVTDGRIRVNFYIKELYGDPSEDAWSSALGTIALLAPPEVFEHPVCQKLLETKWKAFGHRMYLIMQSLYITVIILFYTSFVGFRDTCDGWGIVRLVTGVLAILCVTLQLGVAFGQLRSGQTAIVNISYPGWMIRCTRGRFLPSALHMPRTLMNIWNLMRVPIYTMVAAVVFTRVCLEGPLANEGEDELGRIYDARHIIISICAMALGVLLMEVLLLIPALAAVMLLCQRLVADVVRVLVIVAFVIVSFGAALSVNREPGFETFGNSISSLTDNVLNIASVDMSQMHPWSHALIMLTTIIVYIVLFNVIIAQLVNRCGGIMRHSEQIVHQKIAYACVEMEALLPVSFRKRRFQELMFDEPLDFDNGDSGPHGGITDTEPASIRSHPKYKPDRILRFTGEANASDPWPSKLLQPDVEEEEEDGGY